MDDLIGTMMDAGMTHSDVREALGPTYAVDHDPGAPIEPVVRTLLTVARDDRQPPGSQVAVPSGVLHSLPESKDAKAIRVDTESSYRDFRRGGDGVDMQTLDAPENSETIPDMLNQLAQSEAGLSDSPDFQRGYASQWVTGAGRGRRRHKRSRVGDIMSRGAASVDSLFNAPGLSPDQACLLCGVTGDQSPVCARCASRPDVVGLFARGVASALYDPNPTTRFVRATTLGSDDFYRLQHQVEENTALLGAADFYRLQHQMDERAVLGADADEFYRLQHQLDEGSTLIGNDFYRLQRHLDETTAIGADAGFYRLNWQTQESAIVGATDLYSLNRFLEEAQALSTPSSDRAEAIPLSFEQPDADQHVATWKQGDDLYASVRVTGWDGQPRILTTTMPYARAVSTVVGYATASRIPPSQTMAVLDPLARTLGASQLVPRLAASAPAVLRVAHDKLTPLVLATMPVTNDRV